MRCRALLCAVLVATAARADLAQDFDAGRQAYQAGKFTEAVAAFRACVQASPTDPLFATWYGTALLQAGQTRDAIGVFQDEVAAHPGNAAGHNNLGLAWYRLGSAGMAEAEFRKALAGDPGMSSARFNLSAILIADGKLTEAEALWLERTAAAPGDLRARAALATVLEAQKRYPDAYAEVTQALGPRPKEPTLQAQAARLQVRLGQVDEGIAAFAALGSLPPASTEEFAIALIAAGRPKNALDLLSAADLRPRLSTYGLAALADSLAASGRWEEMIAVLTELAARPEFASLWKPADRARVLAHLAWGAARNQDNATAKARADEALALDPTNVLAASIVGYLKGEGDPLADMEKAVSLGTASLDVMRAYAQRAVGVAGYQPPAKALDALLKVGTEDADQLVRVAILLMRTKRFQDAVSQLAKAIELSPESAGAHNNLGVAYEALGRIDDAVKEYTLALRLDGDSAQARKNLARLRGGGGGG
jgi:superkiller protein 3